MFHFHEDKSSSNGRRAPGFNPGLSEDEEMKAGKSTRWFSYIAVGVIIASMAGGFAILSAVVYLFLNYKR